MKDEFLSYGLDNKAFLPWIKLSEDERKKYLSPLKLIAKAKTHYCEYEVKPVNPFLILRHPGDYA
ncbi:hypothetical protein [Nostoc sp. NMS8]|uniref:hypothetical protein n=1 Tax=Nostoc sp. NMS8 TaxID=2815392 RepID=UPI0025D07F02|nr:hypothetical protein [Nostoc sp. NMS8]MBN3960550.1 hypothetical protein [Nostoc sp. NMS8]